MSCLGMRACSEDAPTEREECWTDLLPTALPMSLHTLPALRDTLATMPELQDLKEDGEQKV